MTRRTTLSAPPLPGTVSRAEWRRVLLLAVGVMLLTTLPYVAGWWAAGDEWRFSGMLIGVEDGHSYLAKMRFGARGELLHRIRYTHEPHGGTLVFLQYALLGYAARLAAGPGGAALYPALVVAFHALRVVGGGALIVMYYRVAAVFLRAPGLRLLATVLMTLGGGLGWVLVLAGQNRALGSLPVEFYIPEGTSFLVLLSLPHLTLARTALLGGLLLLFRAVLAPEPSRAWTWWALGAGLCWAVMGVLVPFYIAVIYAILGSWGLAAWARARRFPWALFWRAAVAALPALPVLIYFALAFTSSDVMRAWSRQNDLPAPHPLHYVLGYAPLALPAVVGLRWAWRRAAQPRAVRDGLALLLAAWIVAAPVLVYLPLNVQRRLAEGVIVPLSILAVIGLRLWFREGRSWRRARALLLAVTLISSLLLWMGAFFGALTPDRPAFRPADEVAALDRLAAAAPDDAVVLSAHATGNVVPARTDLLPYVGHGPETVDADEKEARVAAFFAGALTPTERADLLRVVDYVFYGPLEAVLTRDEYPDADPDTGAWAEGLRLLPGFGATDPYRVYEVLRDDS